MNLFVWMKQLDAELLEFDWDDAYVRGLSPNEAIDEMASRRMAR